MSNDQLRTAIDKAGLQPEQLADLIQVDHRTMQRWLAGRTPYPRHRGPVARALGCDQHDLWPNATTQPTAGKEPPAPQTTRQVAAYASTDHGGVPDWRIMFKSATRQIDMLDYTLTVPTGTLDLLADKAANGCRVRILTSHPESIQLAITEAEQHTGQGVMQKPALAHQAAQALELLRPLQQPPALQVRTFIAQRFNSILRFDNEMLVSLHLWGTSTRDAPVLHLHAGTDDRLFDRFTEHYDSIWNQAAKPVN